MAIWWEQDDGLINYLGDTLHLQSIMLYMTAKTLKCDGDVHLQHLHNSQVIVTIFIQLLATRTTTITDWLLRGLSYSIDGVLKAKRPQEPFHGSICLISMEVVWIVR